MAHPTVEQHLSDCLDACELRRMGLLDGGCYRLQAGIRWPKLESLTIDATSVSVVHRNGQRQTFRISWSKAFRNSRRPWMICNHCGQRYARLFRGFAGYACRECLQLWYACQRKSSRNRQRARLAQLCLRIDYRPSRYLNAQHIKFPKRPPGMHRSRYYRLRGRAADIEAKLLGRRSAFGGKADEISRREPFRL
jgi:hypothetical protein